MSRMVVLLTSAMCLGFCGRPLADADKPQLTPRITSDSLLQLNVAELREMVMEQNFQLQQNSQLLDTAQHRADTLQSQLEQLQQHVQLQQRQLDAVNTKCTQAGKGLQTRILDTGEYYFSSSKKSWYAALRFCKIHGLHLATIDREEAGKTLSEELRNLREEGAIIEGRDRWWLSGSDLENPGEYFWLTTGLDVEWVQLQHHEKPSQMGTGLHCVTLTRFPPVYRMSSELCDLQARFICQVPPLCLQYRRGNK